MVTIYFEYQLTPDKKYHLAVKNWDAVKKMLHMTFAPGRWEFSIDLEAQVRVNTGSKTNKQLAYYFAVVVPTICAALIDLGYNGMTVDATDNYLRQMFLHDQMPNLDTGEYITVYKTLSAISKEDMMVYIDECCFFAANELKTQIPEPNERPAN
jgi:hypothetical protein